MILNNMYGVVLREYHVKVWPPPFVQGTIDTIELVADLANTLKELRKVKK